MKLLNVSNDDVNDTALCEKYSNSEFFLVHNLSINSILSSNAGKCGDTLTSYQTFTCSNSTIKTLKKGVSMLKVNN